MTMSYFCFIPKVVGGTTLKITPPDWAAFRRTTEARHPVTVEVHSFDDPPLKDDCRGWVLEANHRPATTDVSRETFRNISNEIDAFIEPRRTPLPQAA